MTLQTSQLIRLQLRPVLQNPKPKLLVSVTVALATAIAMLMCMIVFTCADMSVNANA